MTVDISRGSIGEADSMNFSEKSIMCCNISVKVRKTSLFVWQIM